MKPALVSTWGSNKKFAKWFLASAKRHGMEPQNSDPGDWPSHAEWWRKSMSQFNFVRAHADEYTHFMFTDSSDIIFAAGWDEIMAKFEKLNSPIVFGAECYCWPDLNKASQYPETPHRCKFLNGGMWMATRDAAIKFVEPLAQFALRKDRCDQGIATDMFLSKQYPIVLDTACSLLYCMNANSCDFIDLSGPRPKTKDTGEEPCLFHGNSGVSLHSIIAKVCP